MASVIISFGFMVSCKINERIELIAKTNLCVKDCV